MSGHLLRAAERIGANPLPPPTNRGAVITAPPSSCRPDWIEGTVWGYDVSDLLDTLAGILVGEWRTAGNGALGYRQRMIGPGEAAVMWDENRPDVHFKLPGKWCGAVGKNGVRRVLLLIAAYGKATRLDIAYDDTERIREPEQLLEEQEAGTLVTNLVKFHAIVSDTGWTYYRGSPHSRLTLRVYDKTRESKGAIDAVRWEVQLRDEYATAAVRALLETEAGQVWATWLVKAVDYRECDGNTNTTRRRRTEWFKRLVGMAEKAMYAVPVPLWTVERAKAWLLRQVAPVLAAVFTAEGGGIEYLEGIMAAGTGRWRVRHYQLAGVMT